MTQPSATRRNEPNKQSAQKSGGTRPAPRTKVTTAETVAGPANRWRRRGEPTLGITHRADGTVDYGIGGPGSVVWDVWLNPVLAVMLTLEGAIMEINYAPIMEGVRSHDPIVVDGLLGKADILQFLTRYQRTGGIPATMVLADSDTSIRIAEHIKHWHRDIKGIIRGSDQWYDANSNREQLMTHVTGMHAAVRIYEAAVFRDGKLPRRLEADKRDQYFAEIGAHTPPEIIQSHSDYPDDPEEPFPTSVQAVKDYYEQHAAQFFKPHHLSRDTIRAGVRTLPNVLKGILSQGQWRVLPPLLLVGVLAPAGLGMAPRKVREMRGIPRLLDPLFTLSTRAALPLFWLLGRPPFEDALVRLYWGPDCLELYKQAKALHQEARGAATTVGGTAS